MTKPRGLRGRPSFEAVIAATVPGPGPGPGPGRTGYFGEVLLLPESADGDQLAERVAQARPLVRRRLIRRLAEQLDDGRAYVVEWQPTRAPGHAEWSTEMLQDLVTAEAIVTLLRPEAAQVGELVHADAFRARSGQKTETVLIGDWCFECTDYGWKRLR